MRITSRVEEATAQCVVVEGGQFVLVNMQEEVDEEAKKWEQEWAVGQEWQQCEWPKDMPQLLALTVDDIIKAARGFPESTGLGWEKATSWSSGKATRKNGHALSGVTYGCGKRGRVDRGFRIGSDSTATQARRRLAAHRIAANRDQSMGSGKAQTH